jgi:hypothetical protein
MRGDLQHGPDFLYMILYVLCFMQHQIVSQEPRAPRAPRAPRHSVVSTMDRPDRAISGDPHGGPCGSRILWLSF